MGWKDEQRERDAAVLEELRAIHARIEELTPAVPPYEPPPLAQGDFARFPGLAVSLRLCRDHEAGTTLLGMLKPVPREHRTGAHGLEVNCLCGSTARATTLLMPCPGGCGRVFVGDESGVWAAMLPAQEAAA